LKKIWISAVLLALGLGVADVAGATRCVTPDLSAYRSLVRPVPPGEMTPTHRGDHPMRPPADPQVGDSWLWYTWSLNGPPTPVERMCTVRGEGQHVYVVVENSQWTTRVNQADVDAIVQAWDLASQGIHPDRGIYDLNTMGFGPAPDMLDNDPKIYVLYYDFDISADGFFWAFDEYPDGTQPYESNECEVLYMNSSDNDPGGSFLISVQAHEFEHMINWFADGDEDSWADEGMAELAMWYYGHPDQVIAFPANPDIDLTTFSSGFADYVKVYLWSLYLYEHYAGEAGIYHLVQDTANGIPAVNNLLAWLGAPQTFVDVYADWIVANFIDDIVFEGGRYGYVGETLPAFSAVTKNTYPVGNTNGSVLRYAADYIKFINGIPQRLRFDGADVGVWKPRVILRSGTTTVAVENIPLDAVDFGTYNLFDFGETYDQVVLVVGKTTPSSSTSYQYGTEAIPADVADGGLSGAMKLHPAEPNPTREGGTVRLELARAQSVRVTIVDPTGRVVRRLANDVFPAGEQAITWDGRDERGHAAAPGVYFVRAQAEDGSATARWVRVQ
jgi:hypothetical protein